LGSADVISITVGGFSEASSRAEDQKFLQMQIDEAHIGWADSLGYSDW